MPLDSKDPKVLQKIGEAIKNGADPKEFESILDEILGTGIKQVDHELENAYEAEIRSK